jgi:hypothetical protein
MVETIRNHEAMDNGLESTKRELSGLRWEVLNNASREKREAKGRVLNLEQFKRLDNEKKFTYLYDHLSMMRVRKVSWGSLAVIREPMYWFERFITFRKSGEWKYSSYRLFKKNWIYILRKHHRGSMETIFEWDDEALSGNRLAGLLNNWYNKYLHGKWGLLA